MPNTNRPIAPPTPEELESNNWYDCDSCLEPADWWIADEEDDCYKLCESCRIEKGL